MSNLVTMNPTVFSPTVGGKAAVTIQCSDSFGLTNDLIPWYIANVMNSDAVFFTAMPEGRQIIPVFERFKASASNHLIAHHIVNASTLFEFNDSQSFPSKQSFLEIDDSVFLSDVIYRYEILGHNDYFQILDLSLATTRSRQDCSDDFIADGSISSTVTLRPQAFDTIAPSDSITTTVNTTSTSSDTLLMTNYMLFLVDQLLVAYDDIIVSQQMRYTLSMQLMEAFKAGSSSLPNKHTLLNISDVIDVSDNESIGSGSGGSGSGGSGWLEAARVVNLQAFDSVSMNVSDGTQSKPPYKLWADGRWAAFYGNGVTGTIKEAP